jgi:hypothetical protein
MTLHGLLETAVQDGIIPSNVAHFKSAGNANQRKTKGEKQARIRAKIFSREQLILFLRAAYEYAASYFALFFLPARTVSESVRLSRCRSAT